ncbi:MAG: DUF5686 family protein [Candidatus Symbiothrix sp.]|jgi:hypothetical protein|nr:DUF5686 family protein [Candidatus Symbiothrix sp.]
MMMRKRCILFLLLSGLFIPLILAQNLSKTDSFPAQLDKEQSLPEVVVKPKRQKYSRKGNLAVEIIRQAIKHKNENRLENKDRYAVEVYEKLLLSMDKFSPDAKDNFLVRTFPSAKQYVDTSDFSHQPVLLVSLREKVYRKYYQKNPETHKNQLIAQRHTGIDKTFDENENLTSNLEEIFKGVNIFDNDITILLNRIVSPLSTPLAVLYYEYYIQDTIEIDGKHYVNISYVPANRQSYGFVGELQIALDGTYSVSRAMLTVSRNINLNWVEKMRIEQVFQPSPDGTQMMVSEDIFADFSPFNGAMPLQAHLSHSFRDYNFDSDLPENDSQSLTDAADWQQLRHTPLPNNEARIDSMMLELKASRRYRRINKLFEIIISGYVPTRFDKSKSRFDFGTISTTFSSNTLEGARFRLGGMTTAKLHPHWFVSGYAAYGLRDEKWKYQGQIVYSFEPRKLHPQERPVHNLSATLRYDVYVPGGNSSFADGDNVFNSLKTGIRETQMQYIRKAEIRYEKEFDNNFSFNIFLKNERNWAAGNLYYLQYQDDGSLLALSDYSTSTAGLQLRYAPGEKLFSTRKGKNAATNLAKDAPIFTLSHQSSFKNLLGSDFSYNYTELRAEKRLWLSSFGHIDLIAKAGKIWDKAPFPMLYFPITNQSLFIQSETFMMMRAMEFIADEYAAVHATYFLKGWILNRLPVINLLKLREVVSFHAICGHLTDKNNPAISPLGLFQLPTDTRLFGQAPYMEASVGLDNIFKILRIDYVRRLNYRSAPDIRKHGFRLAFRFTF